MFVRQTAGVETASEGIRTAIAADRINPKRAADKRPNPASTGKFHSRGRTTS